MGEDLKDDFRFLTALPHAQLPLRNLGLDSIFLLKIPELRKNTKAEHIQKGSAVLKEETCIMYILQEPNWRTDVDYCPEFVTSLQCRGKPSWAVQ